MPLIICRERQVDLTCEEYIKAGTCGSVYDPLKHNVLYSLHKTENISENKVLIAQHVPTNEWIKGAAKVRALLGLPLIGEVSINPTHIPLGYRLFVQSTSWNRKIKAGTHCVVEVTEEQRQFLRNSGALKTNGDTRKAHLTASIGTSTAAVPKVEYKSTFANDHTTLKQTFAKRVANKNSSPTKTTKVTTTERKPKSTSKPRTTKSTKKSIIKKKRTIAPQTVRKIRKFPKISRRGVPKGLIRSRTMLDTVTEGEAFLLACEEKEKKDMKRKIESASQSLAKRSKNM